MPTLLRCAVSRASILGLILVIGAAWTPTVAADPPGRVGRIDHSQGSVGYSPYGEADWIDIERNRPLVRGDRLWTDVDGRAEMQVGNAVVRMAPQTSLELLDLDDEIAQFEVTQGSLNLRVLRLYDRQSYEIATPLLAFVVDRAGRYRIDVDPRRDETTIVVWEGSGEAYGENSRFSLRAGEAVRFSGTDLRRFQVMRLPRADDFDQYCIARDRIRSQSPSLRYVDEDLIGYTDLDEYGAWADSREYGSVWYPRGVAANWAPYRDGRWVWQQPWGWTWVDDAPWGFAPMHYGRWARVNERWGWIPGPRRTRAVFAPALVAFVGGSDWSVSMASGGDSPVGWFPLGPREAYVPTYRASRSYFDRINRHNTTISDANIGTLFSRYERGTGSIAQERYAHRGVLTAVPVSVFAEARPVRGARLRLDPRAGTSGDVLRGLPMSPGPRSSRGMAAITRARPEAAVLERTVYARHAVRAREDAVPLSGPGARENMRQDNRATAARDREQRGRGNVRQLRAAEAQPNARREPLEMRDAGDRGDRESIGQRGESERTGDGQGQRTAQDQVQQQVGREIRRAEQVQQQGERDARRVDRDFRDTRRADESERQADRDARRADEALAAQTREREQVAAQQRDAAERLREQTNAQERAQREASDQRAQAEAQDRRREQDAAQERAQREASEREQAAAREQAEREATSRQGEEVAAQQRGLLAAERQREQDAAQQRAERNALDQQRAQEEARERAAGEAAKPDDRGEGERARGRNAPLPPADGAPGDDETRNQRNRKDADDEEADKDKDKASRGERKRDDTP